MPAPSTSTIVAPSVRLAPPGGGRFSAIIFDMGGTLLEFENVPWDALYPSSVHSLHNWLARHAAALPTYDAFLERFEVLLDRRRKRSREEMREYHITPLIRELIAGFGISLRIGDLSAAVDAYYAAIRRQVTVFPDSKETLTQLKHLGYKVGLLSNTPFRVRDHHQELEHFGLWPHFDATLFTSTIKYRKPHPDPFRIITKRLAVLPERSLYVGDRQVEDVQGPQAIGMIACLIRRNERKYQIGLTECHEINALSQLLGLLGRS
jgi:putative hydrolase of the HAD superfamily